MTEETTVLSVERATEIHAEGLEAHGGAGGLKDQGRLESALGAAKTAALYCADEGQPLDPLVYASQLLVYLARGHAFVDGNKRLAWSAFVEVLGMNELGVDATDDEAHQLVTNVITEGVSAEQVADWTYERLASPPASE